MREKILKKLADWHAYHPWTMLIAIILLTVLLISLAGKLSVTMRVSDLLPEENPKVVQFNKVVDEFATATNLIIVVQGEEERIKSFANDLAPQILKLKDSSQNETIQDRINILSKKLYDLNKKQNKTAQIKALKKELKELNKRIDIQLFQRVDYKNEIEFLRHHMLMLVKAEDLKNMKEIYANPNLTELITHINNSMEKEYVEQEESISTREKEDGAVSFLDGIQTLVQNLKRAGQGESLSDSAVQATADKLLFGDPYMLSYDKSTLLMIGIPNFTIMDRDLLQIAANEVQKLVDTLLKKYPDVQAGLSGSVARERDEHVYAEQSFSYSTIIALVFILVLLIISFKMWVAPIFAIATLIIGVIWAMGASYLAVGQLNMMTAMMAVILLGLGIDFAIHLISGFTERRAAGDTIPEALQTAFLNSAKGIITGAFTTACAFLSLMISAAPGLRELGIVIGVGLLSILAATMLALPLMLVFRERWYEYRQQMKSRVKTGKKQNLSFRFLGNTGQWLSQHYLFSIIISIVVTGLLVFAAFQIKFDHNMMNIEPEGLPSIALQDTILDKFDLNVEYALSLASSVDESRDLAKAYRDLGSVALTDDISLYLPSREEQQERIPYLKDIQQLMQTANIRHTIDPSELPKIRQEIERLEMNVMEMQDMAFLGGQDKVDNKCKKLVGVPGQQHSRNIVQELLNQISENQITFLNGISAFQDQFAPYYKQSVLKMCNTKPIRFAELPETILDRYANKTRDKFLVTIFPSGNLWENKAFLDRFTADMERVSVKTTGSGPLFVALIDIFARDGRNAILLTIVIVFFLLWVDFKKVGHSLLAMVPLACGIFWMVGLMFLTGMKFNFVNMIGLPLIIGIGIDDGVHILHRWRKEGCGQIQTVFASTGKAIFLTSLTTMFAFGSLYFTVFRGWASFGAALFLGVGACFLTTVLVLPGILGAIQKRNHQLQTLKGAYQHPSQPIETDG